MSEDTFTLRAVVKALREAFNLPEDPSHLRTVRYWVSEGLLRPTGAVHTGKGKSRIFTRDEILRAAILFECARWNVTVGTMKRLLRKIEDVNNEDSLVAFARTFPRKFLEFSFTGSPPRCKIVTMEEMPADGRSLLCIDVKQLATDLGLLEVPSPGEPGRRRTRPQLPIQGRSTSRASAVRAGMKARAD